MDRKGRPGRETIGLVLLTALLLTGLCTSLKMDRHHAKIARQLEDSAWYALSGDWEKARSAAAAAENSWESWRMVTSLLSDHTPMEEIDSLFSRIGVYSAARSGTEFAACCGDLSRKMAAMGEAHRLSWQNLL